MIDIDAIEARANAATPGPWDRAYRTFTSLEDFKDWLGRMIGYAPDNLFLHGAVHMLDGTHAPEFIDDVWSFVMPMISGNGPTAEANALFCCAARSDVPALCAEVRRLRKMLDAAQSDRAASEPR